MELSPVPAVQLACPFPDVGNSRRHQAYNDQWDKELEETAEYAVQSDEDPDHRSRQEEPEDYSKDDSDDDPGQEPDLDFLLFHGLKVLLFNGFYIPGILLGKSHEN